MHPHSKTLKTISFGCEYTEVVVSFFKYVSLVTIVYATFPNWNLQICYADPRLTSLTVHSADSSIKLSSHNTTQIQTSEVKWGACFSGHWVVTNMFALVTLNKPSYRQLKKTSNCRRSQLNQYWSYKPHSNFRSTWIFLGFCMCPSNDTFDKNKKSWCRYWGSTAKTGSLRGINQT